MFGTLEDLYQYLPLSIMCIGAIIVLIYHLLYHQKLAGHVDRRPIGRSQAPTSVIICARNEEENLREHLPYFLAQDHPQYEVVVVNDGSWDDTSHLIGELAKENDHLHYVEIGKDAKRTAGKKFALTLGIKKAEYDRLIFSDADCRPASTQWLSRMSGHLEKDFVLGYGRYERKTGWLNRLIRYDTFQAACLYLSKAKVGTAYMGVGRNMGYRREVYDKAGGFKSHYHIPAGDDDLFVNANARPGSASVCLDPDAHTFSQPESRWRDWIRQKKRHIGVSSHYSPTSKRWLGLYHSGQGMYYIGMLVGMALWCPPILLLSIFLLKTLIQLLIVRPLALRLKEKDLLCLIPILEPVLLMSNILIAIGATRSKVVEWK